MVDLAEINIDIAMLSGVDSIVESVKGELVINFAPHVGFEIEDGVWLTQEDKEVVLTEGKALPKFPPTAIGRAYAVKERGWTGAREGFVKVPDQAQVNYSDLVWVTKDSLDPIPSDVPAWAEEIEVLDTRVDDLEDEVLDLDVRTDELEIDVDDVIADLATKSSIGHTHAASVISVTPSGLIVATNVQAALAELDTKKQVASAMLSDLTALAGTLTDDQQLKWNMAQGKLVAMNPIGTSLNAKNQNVTGVTTTVTGGAGTFGAFVDIPTTAISVLNSAGREVKLEFEGHFQQSALGTGEVWFCVAETTSGTVYRRYHRATLSNSITAGLNQRALPLVTVDIGVVTTTRTFKLVAAVFSVTGTPAVQFYNQPQYPSLLRAQNQ